ncbi:hypothetical protein IEQ34_006978 [Dendrobium chrysotoxum]|uniref:DUF7880 domain-containing protein n=1 Tax=Dendrobium chrysotoxum TaxID=161865 RepID=A0AAV7H8I5_DENCH|nr:hypothetical protein IEQ34_006978 [Dendrobium chrysotoxum]
MQLTSELFGMPKLTSYLSADNSIAQEVRVVAWGSHGFSPSKRARSLPWRNPPSLCLSKSLLATKSLPPRSDLLVTITLLTVRQPEATSCWPAFRRASCAAAGSPFDKYVKRKKLEPLEAYVPAVLLTEEQFKDLEDSLDVEQPKYDISRSLLRSGPAASLRVNIRAVAQYADDDGKGKAASDAVDRCLRALEDLDSLLLHALRNDPTATIKSMKIKINVALESLDSLLQTVPASVLDKGKAIADSYRVPYLPTEEKKSEELDPELKKLEAIL